MKSLIVYDSIYGNTKIIAEEISKQINGSHIQSVKGSAVPILKPGDLLIVGSPVHGGRPTPLTEMYLSNISNNSLKGVYVAGFDTRFAPEDHGLGLRILITIIRYAAEKISAALIKKGGIQVVKPQGFIVKDKEGPLEKGELEKAKIWASRIQKEVA